MHKRLTRPLFAMALAAPLAVLGFLATPNIYRAMGVDGVDCDGPLGVLLFALPALLVYLPVGVWCTWVAFRWQDVVSGVLAVVCLAVCGGLLIHVSSALSEHFDSGHVQSCGAGL